MSIRKRLIITAGASGGGGHDSENLRPAGRPGTVSVGSLGPVDKITVENPDRAYGADVGGALLMRNGPLWRCKTNGAEFTGVPSTLRNQYSNPVE